MRYRSFLTCWLAVVACSVVCGQTPTTPPSKTPAADAQPLAAASDSVAARPDHWMQLSPRVYSGAQPLGDAQFAELARVGIKTIVSVDGARPDIDLANKYGLRYVHVPFGYDGIAQPSQAALTRVARETAGPIFVHCHHGKHRGPAAAAMVCLAGEEIDRAAAVKVLKQAGTSRQYAGLWRAIETYRPLPAGAPLPELVAVAEIDHLVGWMASLGRAADHLKLAQQANWKAPTDHPDLVRVAQAVLLREGLHESLRLTPDEAPADYRAAMRLAEQLAQKLQTAIETNQPATASKHFNALLQRCAECHTHHRN